jgi:glyoxylase-like metal-dependent hydrolase (beta-lactamase superfamily II)
VGGLREGVDLMSGVDVRDNEQVSEKVTMIPLPLPLDGLDWVNCFAITGSDGITLVDPGWYGAATDAALARGLGLLGADLGDVRRVLVTHGHWDHYSAAVGLRLKTPLEIWLGHGEHFTLDSVKTYVEGQPFFPHQTELLRTSGADDLAWRLEHLATQDFERGIPFGEPDHWLDGGERLDLGGTTVVAWATPGHTRGHIAFELPGEGLIMTGDHVLPHITPSVGFERVPNDRPLASYLSSLELLANGPKEGMLPAHLERGDDVRIRAQELMEHHERRLDEIADFLSDGPKTAFRIAEGMRWTKRARTLEELPTTHAMNAVMEVRAHLEHLVETGRAAKKPTALETYERMR